jgi:O-antigen/teichoic acid export membrane protein
MSLRKKILSDSAWVLFGRVSGALLGLAFYSLLTRMLPPEDVGTYFLALSVATVLATIASLGLPRTSTRLLAEATTGHLPRRTQGLITRSLALTLTAGAVLAIAYVTILGDWLARSIFKNPALITINGYIAAWFILFALRLVIAESFRGLGNVKLASLFGGLVSNAITTALVAIAFIYLSDFNVTHAAIYTLLGLVLSIASSAVMLLRQAPMGNDASRVQITSILAISLPILLIEIVQVILGQSSTWILGGVASESQVAIYGTVLQIVLLVSFPFMIVNNAIPQLLVKFNAEQQHDKLERMLQTIATVAFLPALVLMIGLIFFGRPLLETVYGEAYGAGAAALIWLAAGQLVNVATGSCGIALMLTGHQNSVMWVTAAAAAVAVPLAIVLSDRYGATGAAASDAMVMAGQNIALVVLAKRRVGVRTYISFSTRILRQIRAGIRP